MEDDRTQAVRETLYLSAAAPVSELRITSTNSVLVHVYPPTNPAISVVADP